MQGFDSVSTWHGFKHEEHFPWPFLEHALEGALAHAEIAANLGLHQELDHDVPLDEWLHLQSLELLPDDENHELARLSTMLQMLVAKGCRWLTYFALHRIACLVDEDKHGYLDAPMIIGDLAPWVQCITPRRHERSYMDCSCSDQVWRKSNLTVTCRDTFACSRESIRCTGQGRF